MRHHLRYLFAVVALVTAACSDNQLAPDRATAPSIAPGPRFSVFPPPECTTPEDEIAVAAAQKTVDTLLPQIFGPGKGRRGTAQGYSNNIVQARRNGNTTVEQDYVVTLINYTLENYYAGNLIDGQSPETQTRVLNFFYALYGASSICPVPDLSGIFGAENAVLIRDVTPDTVVRDPLNYAGVKIKQGDVPDDIFGTYVSIYRTNEPLPTSLDWYGVDGYRQGAFEFVSHPEVTFDSPVLTGVCIVFDDAIASATDLRLAHGVEVGDVPAPGNSIVTTLGGIIEIANTRVSTVDLNLGCPPLPVASLGMLGRLLEQFANLIVPQQLYAAVSSGSTGGTVRKFSPFAAVDTKLLLASSGPASPEYIPLDSTSIDRPVSVTVTTRYDVNTTPTPIDGIAVAFGATGPAGSGISPASDRTEGNGTASATWTLVAGANSATGTPSQAALSFCVPPLTGKCDDASPDHATFSVTVVQETSLAFGQPATLPNGVLNTAYYQTFTATGGRGAGSYSWAVTAGSLPNGLTLDSGTGVLSGTATTAGTFSFTVTVTSGAQTASRPYSNVVITLPPVSITTASLLPTATLGAWYSTTLAASGGLAGSYGWSLEAGSNLPDGLSLTSAGVISGTASVLGDYGFVVRVTSGTGATAVTSTKTFELPVINPTAITLTFDVGPDRRTCYVVNQPMNPGIRVKVRDQNGNPLSGVTVDLVAVTNNGANVTVSPASMGSIGGLASFGGPTISKTGGYALIASTTTPRVASVTSGKFNISPSC